MTLAVAVSGGIDSLCALLKLHEAGEHVCALHARFLSSAPALPESLRAPLEKLAIPVHTLDLRQNFRDHVLIPSLLAWHRGDTPNPCALCNRFLKFGFLLQSAQKLGYTTLATGHYARLDTWHGHLLLCQAKDKRKDQSYFLSLIAGSSLPHLRFPLSTMSKDDCRKYLANRGFTAQSHMAESQDVCFLPQKSQLEFFFNEHWQKLGLEMPQSGPLVLVDALGHKNGKKRRHQGLWRYTEGQRRGLGVPGTEGYYVLKKDQANNTLVIGPQTLLGMEALRADQVNLFVEPCCWPDKLMVKVRYRQEPAACEAVYEGGNLHIRFASPQFPTAKGQLVSLATTEGHILAGGIVQELRLSSEDLF